MEAKVCIDTDVLIGALRGYEPAVGRVKGLEGEGAILSTTSINVFELCYGALKTKEVERNLKAVKELLERLVVFDFTEEVAERAGGILAELEIKGQAIDFRDLFVGATALVNGHALLTKNVAHFKRIGGLKLLAVS